MNFFEAFHCQRPYQDSKAWIDHSARNDNFHAIGGCEEIGHGKGVGNNLRRLAFEVLGDVIDGSACINDNALVCGNQVSGSATNGFFFRELMRVPGSKSEFVRSWIHDAGTAMG